MLNTMEAALHSSIMKKNVNKNYVYVTENTQAHKRRVNRVRVRVSQG